MRRIILWTLSSVVVVTILLVIAAPEMIAFTFPRIFGMVRLSDNLYVERNVSPEEQKRLIAAHAEARRRVTAYFGSVRKAPHIMACSS
jgi:hypothetical protein